MKKFFLLAAFAASTLGFAQDISIGAKAGVNLSNISYSGEFYKNSPDSKMLTSFHVGGLLELKLTDMIALQPELLFSSQGAKQESLEDNETVKIESKSTSKYNYLTLPIMGKFYVAEGLSLEVGPQIGYLLSAKAKSEGSTEIKLTNTTTSASSEANIKETKSASNLDFGINAGLSYKLDSGLFVGARYNFGFSNINSGKFKDPNTGTEVELTDDQLKEMVGKNSVIQISVGYFFK